MRLITDLATEIIMAEDHRMKRKENNLQPRILFPVKITSKSKGKIKTFPIKQKLRDCIISTGRKKKKKIKRNSSGRRKRAVGDTLECGRGEQATEGEHTGPSK